MTETNRADIRRAVIERNIHLRARVLGHCVRRLAKAFQRHLAHTIRKFLATHVLVEKRAAADRADHPSIRRR